MEIASELVQIPENAGKNGISHGDNGFLKPDQLVSPDISITRNNMLRRYRPLMGDSTPYGSPEFELASPIGEVARQTFIAEMTSLPAQPVDEGRLTFRASPDTKRLSNVASTFMALEMLYEGPSFNNGATPEDVAWTRLSYENIHNAMAVRNRLRIVKEQFRNHLDGLLRTKTGDIHVLSIAAGSCRGMFEVMADLKEEDQKRVKLRLVDTSREALDYAQKLAKDLHVNDQSLETIRATFKGVKRFLGNGYKPDFVEIVGLLDYVREDEEKKDVTELLTAVYENMADGGTLIYSNIAPNDEDDEECQGYTHRIVGWPPMKYRTIEDLKEWAERAGFATDRIEAIEEPLKIYNLIVATK